jgi:hypothetical protein
VGIRRLTYFVTLAQTNSLSGLGFPSNHMCWTKITRQNFLKILGPHPKTVCLGSAPSDLRRWLGCKTRPGSLLCAPGLWSCQHLIQGSQTQSVYMGHLKGKVSQVWGERWAAVLRWHLTPVGYSAV